jgi:hypothetical protein
VYVPADDLTDPAPATTFAHLDATTVLSRQVRLPPQVFLSSSAQPHEGCYIRLHLMY